MATYIQHTWSNVATFLANLSEFLTDNGWSVSVSTTTQVKASKGGSELTFSYYNANAVTINSKYLGLTSQSVGLWLGTNYGPTYIRFVSCGNDLYIGRDVYYNSYNYYGWKWFGYATVEKKFGVWGGGPIINGMRYDSISYTNEDHFFNGSMAYQSNIFYEGAWVPAGLSVGGPWGSTDASPFPHYPNYFNANVIPIPVIVALFDTNTSYLHPIGELSTLFRGNGGNVYSSGEEITVGDSSFVFHNETKGYMFKVA